MTYGFLLSFAFVRTIFDLNWFVYVKLYFLQLFTIIAFDLNAHIMLFRYVICNYIWHMGSQNYELISQFSNWSTIRSRFTVTSAVVITIFTHVVRPYFRLYVRKYGSTFQNPAKRVNNIQVKTVIATGGNMCLAEWIMNDSFLYLYMFYILHLNNVWSSNSLYQLFPFESGH